MRSLLVVGLLSCVACQSGQPNSAGPDPLVAVLRSNRLQELCADESYERACFDMDAPGCRTLVAKHYDACATEHASEISIQAKASPTTLGTILGGCTERNLIAEMEKLGKVNREGKCAKPSNFSR